MFSNQTIEQLTHPKISSVYDYLEALSPIFVPVSILKRIVNRRNANDSNFGVTGLYKTALVYNDKLKRERMEVFLEHGANVNCQNLHPEDPYWNTILHLLMANEDYQGVKTFIGLAKKYNQKINYDIQDREQKTPLLLAAKMRRQEMVQILLKEGAGNGINVNSQDSHGNTALHYACAYGDVVSIQALLSAKANTKITNNENKTPIDMIFSQEREIKELMASVCIEPERDEAAIHNEFMDLNGNPLTLKSSGKPCDLIATKKNIPSLRKLLKNPLFSMYDYATEDLGHDDCHVENRNKSKEERIIGLYDSFTGRSLLQACKDGRADALEIMLQQDLSLAPRYFRIAASLGKVEMLKQLNAMDPELKNQTGPGSLRSALHFSALNEQKEACEFLLSLNDFYMKNSQDSDGNTALHLACSKGNYLAIQVLLKHDADPRIENKEGRTALQIFNALPTSIAGNKNRSAIIEALHEQCQKLDAIEAALKESVSSLSL